MSLSKVRPFSRSLASPQFVSPHRNGVTHMINRRTFSTTLAATAAASLFSVSGQAQTSPRVRNVVLVHGAYADGSSWSDVIGRLQVAGLRATAVQNPLTSL